MPEQRWWIRTQVQPDQSAQWHLEMHKEQGAACGYEVSPPIERVTQQKRPERADICDECRRIEPFADGMSHSIGSGGRLPEPP